MNGMLKKLGAIGTSVTLLLSFAACGSGNKVVPTQQMTNIEGITYELAYQTEEPEWSSSWMIAQQFAEMEDIGEGIFEVKSSVGYESEKGDGLFIMKIAYTGAVQTLAFQSPETYLNILQKSFTTMTDAGTDIDIQETEIQGYSASRVSEVTKVEGEKVTFETFMFITEDGIYMFMATGWPQNKKWLHNEMERLIDSIEILKIED